MGWFVVVDAEEVVIETLVSAVVIAVGIVEAVALLVVLLVLLEDILISVVGFWFLFSLGKRDRVFREWLGCGLFM